MRLEHHLVGGYVRYVVHILYYLLLLKGPQESIERTTDEDVETKDHIDKISKVIKTLTTPNPPLGFA